MNVWASWCAPCREEHPLLLGLSQDRRFDMAGLNYKDQPENARRFLGSFGNPYPAIGVDGAGRAAIDWGVYGVPETFLVGKDGKILFKHVGPLTEQAVARDAAAGDRKGAGRLALARQPRYRCGMADPTSQSHNARRNRGARAFPQSGRGLRYAWLAVHRTALPRAGRNTRPGHADRNRARSTGRATPAGRPGAEALRRPACARAVRG